MRFIVTRTSTWGEAKPCPSAFKAEVTGHTYYTFRSVAEATVRYPDREFESYGAGIRTTGTTESVWCVDLDSLDALMAFYGDHGPVVIEPWYRNHELPVIDIYDGYRE